MTFLPQDLKEFMESQITAGYRTARPALRFRPWRPEQVSGCREQGGMFGNIAPATTFHFRPAAAGCYTAANSREPMMNRTPIAAALCLTFAACQARAKDKEMEFVRIPAGSFLMGCTPGDRECYDDEKPAHPVRIPQPFEIGRYEVTQAQWETLMGSNPSLHRGPDLPVESVTWEDVSRFLERLNRRGDGYHYRLPTEAEWEYAARAGSGAPPNLDAAVWYDANSEGHIHPVGTRQPNAWGLYDMLGNAWEWCSDWAREPYHRLRPLPDPVGPDAGQCRIIRGGSWGDSYRTSRVSLRHWVLGATRSGRLGLRCLREPSGRQGDRP
jgi:formylglycine-generating enzyme required for sulfatase activity